MRRTVANKGLTFHGFGPNSTISGTHISDHHGTLKALLPLSEDASHTWLLIICPKMIMYPIEISTWFELIPIVEHHGEKSTKSLGRSRKISRDNWESLAPETSPLKVRLFYHFVNLNLYNIGNRRLCERELRQRIV